MSLINQLLSNVSQVKKIAKAVQKSDLLTYDEKQIYLGEINNELIKYQEKLFKILK